MFNSKSFFILLIFFAAFKSVAQDKSIITHYSTADGLPDNRIRTIVKDKEGFIWLASWLGISRFDGHRFLNFKSYPGDQSNLGSNRIDELIDDGDGSLWLRSYDNQLYRFDKKSFRFLSLAQLVPDQKTPAPAFAAILHAERGKVWLKTESKGLFFLSAKVDSSYELSNYSVDKKGSFHLPSNAINFLFADSRKNIWIGTQAGLKLLSYRKGKLYGDKSNSAFANRSFTSIAESNGRVWLGTASGTVLSVNPATLQTKAIHIGNDAVNGLLVSKLSKKIYCTTASGKLFIISATGKLESNKNITSGSALFSIYEDRYGLLWLEPEKVGVWKYDPGSGKVSYFEQANLTNYFRERGYYKVFEDRKGLLWTVMQGWGFGYYNRKADRIEYFKDDPRSPYNSFSNMVNSAICDDAGVMWISTLSRGLEKIVFQNNDFDHQLMTAQRPSEIYNEVRAVFSDSKNRLWISAKNTGVLYIYRDGQLQNGLFVNPPENWQGIYSIIEDSKGRIWLGTKGNGVFVAEPVDAQKNSYRVRNLKSRFGFYSLLEDRKGRIWAGTYGHGLVRIADDNNTLKLEDENFLPGYPKESFQRVRHLAQDVKGNIWIGTTDGLAVFNPYQASSKKYHFHLYRKQPGDISSLGGNDVQYIYRDSRNLMWVCTSAGGLNRADGDPLKSLRFKNYSEKNGLPSDYILSATEDKRGFIWLATQNGFAKFDPKTERFYNFGLYDGVSGVEFSEASVTKLQNNRLVFGATEGFWSFDPLRVGSDRIQANLAFTNFQVNNRDVFPGEASLLHYSIDNTQKVELDYDQSTISLDFAVLDYRAQTPENYLYRLKGFDSDWQASKEQRRVTYTNLPPGNYTFEVKTSNDYLYKNLPYRSVKITIFPPLWRTWWAYLLYLALAFVLFILLRKNAITMLKLRQAVAVERKVADMKIGFFTQVAHELRTPLTLIISPLDEVLQRERLSLKGSEYIHVVIKNARRMVRLVNQILDLRKAQSGKSVLKVSQVEVISFTKSVIEYFSETVRNRGLVIEINTTVPELLVWMDAEKIDIVLYNLLANAIKFSPDNGRIEINIKRASNTKSFTIEVADEGSGVEESELKDIFELYYEGKHASEKQTKGTGIGLALSRELVELHKGSIRASNGSPHGLKVIVELLIGREHFNPQTTQFINLPVFEHQKQETFIDNQFELKSETELVDISDKIDLPTVLVVEDNEDLRNFLAGKLAGHYNVLTARDGAEGWNRAKDALPDLIVSDIMMPKVDGIRLLDMLKNDISTSHIPVVLLTAKFSVESQIESLRYGADYYMSKPFQMDLLEAVIKSLIGHRKKLFQTLLTGKKIDELSSEEVVITSHDQVFLEKVISVVEEKLADSEFNIDDVAESARMSRSAFYKKFKSLTNMAPVEFVRETRLKRAKKMFDAGETNVSTVAYAVGFNNPKYFSTCFRMEFSKTPTEYIRDLKS